MVVFVTLICALTIFQNVESFNPQQKPANSWVYFGRGLNQREIIDLAKPKEEETPILAATLKPEEITTEKNVETTLESRITSTGPTTTTLTPTTATSVATKEIPSIRNLPESVIVSEVNESTTTSSTTLEPLELSTDSKKEELKLTSESPLRAKIVVIPKEIIIEETIDAISEVNATTTTTDAVVLEVNSTTTEAPLLKLTNGSTAFPKEPIAIETSETPTKKSSKEESSASSEETDPKVISLRSMLRRIFRGDLFHRNA